MPVTFQEVYAALNRDEPDYQQAAQLGSEAIPHLMKIVEEGDPGLASKATYLAGFINSPQSIAVLERAANNYQPIVRTAAAGALRYLDSVPENLYVTLLNDQDFGVRKLSLMSAEAQMPAGLKNRLQDIAAGDPEIALREIALRIVTKMP